MKTKNIFIKSQIVLLSALVMLFSFALVRPALAQDCSDAGNTIAIVQCHEQHYVKADKELNVIYTEAMKTLPAGQKAKLKEAQKAWLKFRDLSLEFSKELNSEMRSFGSVVFADYKAKIVEKRVLELKYLMQSPEGPVVKW